MPRFVKQTFTGYKDVPGGASDPELEYVIHGKSEYEELWRRIHKAEKEEYEARQKASTNSQEWKQKYDSVYEAYKSWKQRAEELAEEIENQEAIPEGMVAITEQELNGYKKAVRIVRDRAKQQIDKAKADEHGYTLMRADKRQYDREAGKAWLITMSTPYSIKLSLSEASAIIERDLRDFYGLRDRPIVEEFDYGYRKVLSVSDLLEYYERFIVNGEETHRIGNMEMIRGIRWLMETKGRVAFELSRISRNIATGCYEVSYWATEPM